MRRNKRREERLKREFLPEAMELIEKPASPWGHFGIIVICIIVIVMLLWAVWGRVDVTVTARGKLAAGGEKGTQIVQSENGGRIRSIKVKEGQKVKKGDVLLEFISETQKGVKDFYLESQGEAVFKEKLIRQLQNHKALGNLPGTEREMYQEVYEYMVSVKDRNETKINGIKQEIDNARTELREGRAEIDGLRKEAEDYRELYEGGAVPKISWEEKKKEYRLQRQNTEIAQQKLESLKNSLSAARSEYENELSGMLLECHKEIGEGKVTSEQSENDLENCFVKAPVSGTVKSLLIYTEGAVVTPAQKIMEIVPEREEYLMELSVLNQDIGYIKKGQSVTIKFDTYDYQVYGKAEGTVEYISPDSFADERLGEIYMVRVRLSEKELNQKYKGVKWLGGIQGTAEIKTGERRIINFFVEPVREHLDGSLNTP